jgi:excisionase family DNA binding protein
VLLSVQDTCKQLSIGRTLAYKLISNRDLDIVRIGGRTLVTVESIRKLIERKLA